jgi:hypothetical protein
LALKCFGYEQYYEHHTELNKECKCLVQVRELYVYKYTLHYFLCSCVVSFLWTLKLLSELVKIRCTTLYS